MKRYILSLLAIMLFCGAFGYLLGKAISPPSPKLLTKLSDNALLHWHVESLFELEMRGFQNVRHARPYWIFSAEKYEWKPLPNGGRYMDFSDPTNGVPYRWNWWEIQTNGAAGWTTVARHKYL